VSQINVKNDDLHEILTNRMFSNNLKYYTVVYLVRYCVSHSNLTKTSFISTHLVYFIYKQQFTF